MRTSSKRDRSDDEEEPRRLRANSEILLTNDASTPTDTGHLMTAPPTAQREAPDPEVTRDTSTAQNASPPRLNNKNASLDNGSFLPSAVVSPSAVQNKHFSFGSSQPVISNPLN